jgi:hypothetical protein
MRACFGFDSAESAVAQRCTRACSSSAASTPTTPAAAIASSNGATPSAAVAVARILSWRRKPELADANTNALVTGTVVRIKKGFIVVPELAFRSYEHSYTQHVSSTTVKTIQDSRSHSRSR